MAEERLELENAEITRQRKLLDATYVTRPNKDITFDFNPDCVSYSQNVSNLSANETLSTSKVNVLLPVLVDHYGRSLPLMAGVGRLADTPVNDDSIAQLFDNLQLAASGRSVKAEPEAENMGESPLLSKSHRSFLAVEKSSSSATLSDASSPTFSNTAPLSTQKLKSCDLDNDSSTLEITNQGRSPTDKTVLHNNNNDVNNLQMCTELSDTLQTVNQQLRKSRRLSAALLVDQGAADSTLKSELDHILAMQQLLEQRKLAIEAKLATVSSRSALVSSEHGACTSHQQCNDVTSNTMPAKGSTFTDDRDAHGLVEATTSQADCSASNLPAFPDDIDFTTDASIISGILKTPKENFTLLKEDESISFLPTPNNVTGCSGLRAISTANDKKRESVNPMSFSPKLDFIGEETEVPSSNSNSTDDSSDTCTPLSVINSNTDVTVVRNASYTSTIDRTSLKYCETSAVEISPGHSVSTAASTSPGCSLSPAFNDQLEHPVSSVAKISRQPASPSTEKSPLHPVSPPAQTLPLISPKEVPMDVSETAVDLSYVLPAASGSGAINLPSITTINHIQGCHLRTSPTQRVASISPRALQCQSRLIRSIDCIQKGLPSQHYESVLDRLQQRPVEDTKLDGASQKEVSLPSADCSDNTCKYSTPLLENVVETAESKADSASTPQFFNIVKRKNYDVSQLGKCAATTSLRI